MSQATFAILGFDTERDGIFGAYKGITDGVPRILDLLDQQEVSATFFFVATAAEKFPATVRDVMAGGHEVGCHSYDHELLGDELRPVPGESPLLLEERVNRTKVATKILRKTSGKKIVSFRAPHGWQSTEVINTLETLGYKVDLSYSPAYPEHGSRIRPYHPSTRDWTQEGRMRILEVPLLDYVADEGRGPLGRKFWPNWRLKGIAWSKRLIERRMKEQMKKDGISVLNIYMHPWEFVKMPRVPVRTSEFYIRQLRPFVGNTGMRAVRELRKLTSHLKKAGVKFVTAAEFAKLWGERERRS